MKSITVASVTVGTLLSPWSRYRLTEEATQ